VAREAPLRNRRPNERLLRDRAFHLTEDAFMKKPFLLFVLTLSAAALAACSKTTPTVSGPAGAPAPAATCQLTATDNTTSYLEPGSGADQFATFDTGATVMASVKTADGWYGYEPEGASTAFPQILRYRWVWPALGWSVAATGCDVPIVTGPESGVCYYVAAADTPVRSAGIDVADVVATLPAGGYAALIATTPDWIELDLSRGSQNTKKEGWVSATGALYYGFCGPLGEMPGP
jgi:hypothetical protein